MKSRTLYWILGTWLAYLAAMMISSCHTSKSSVSLRESSETASLRSSRLSTSLSIDTITKYFALHADSLVFIFGETPSGRFSEDNPYGYPIPAEKSIPSSDDLSGSSDDVYFFSGSPADKSTREQSHRPFTPSLGGGRGEAVLKVYGLHTSAGSSKQSIQQSSSSDSNDKSMQSEKHEEDNVKKSSPFPLKIIIFFSCTMATAIFIYIKVRR